jgi:hypothetical protein
MGKIEKKVRKANIQRIILESIQVAGVLSMLALGFKPNDINIGGHSHGAYTAFFLAAEIKRIALENGRTGGAAEVNSIVALDPAVNPWFADNQFPSSGQSPPFINFGAVSRHSLSFVSSELGSENLADTADTFIRVQSSQGSLLAKHGFAVTLFSDILAKEKAGNTDPKITRFFSSSIMSTVGTTTLAKRAGAEGTIYINTTPDTNDANWLKAHFDNFSIS